MNTRLARTLPTVTAMLVLLVGGWIGWQVTLGFKAFTWESYRRLQVEREPRAVPDIPLQTHQGEHWQLSAAAGKLRLVNFIYTRCPTLCRTSGSFYARLVDAIEQRGWDDRIQLISISLQPMYDNPVRLRAFRQRYQQRDNDLWLTTRATNRRDHRQLLKAYGVVSIPDPWGGIQHNDALHLIDTSGRLVRILDNDLDRLLNKLAPRVQERVALAFD
ncbi:MAG: SCO family protein [Pseudomonadota bacterium]|nr:SCO family protein [Pseudomonadota bacterium]